MKIMKKALVLVMAICIIAVGALAVPANAAQTPKIEGIQTPVLVCQNHSWGVYATGGAINSTAKITSVKSSNPNVIQVYFDKKTNDCTYTALAGGKATLTFKVRQKGQTYTIKKTVKAVKDKPFTYIKYGNKELYKGNEYITNFQYGMKSGQKITWKLKSGYKLVSANYFIEGVNNSDKPLKKGTVLKLKQGNFTWCVFNIKTPSGAIVEYRVLLQK